MLLAPFNISPANLLYLIPEDSTNISHVHPSSPLDSAWHIVGIQIIKWYLVLK